MEHIKTVKKTENTTEAREALTIPWEKMKSMLAKLVVARAMNPKLDLQHFEKLESKKTIQNFHKF